MVRYPHRVTIFGDNGKIEDGEWISSEIGTIEIRGRFEHKNSTYSLSESGDSINIIGEFFTNAKADSSAMILEFNGEQLKIVNWFQYQTYSHILLQKYERT